MFVGKKDYPIGQCCVDVMNLNKATLDEIDRRVRQFIPVAQKLPIEKTGSAAALAQERLNTVWELIFALLVYRDLRMDESCCFHTFRRLMADREKWAQVQDPSSEGYTIYRGMMAGFACFAESIRVFRQQVTEMTRKYFEPLKRRTNGAYAEAYSRFYADMLSVGAHIFNDEFEQSLPLEVNFVPMLHPTEEGRVFVAEKSTFNSLADFLRTEFYRGLALGNAPRQCRKVGAHRKEALGKANRTPARKEYDRTYNRLKARKQRGKISVDEWNAAVAKAQELLERSKRGELTDEELKCRFEEF